MTANGSKDSGVMGLGSKLTTGHRSDLEMTYNYLLQVQLRRHLIFRPV